MRKIAVITGASRGIGAATTSRLASDGYDVCVNYLKLQLANLLCQDSYDVCVNYFSNSSAAEDVVTDAKSFGVKAIAVQADISSEEQVQQLFDTVSKELGSPDVEGVNGRQLHRFCYSLQI